MDFDMKVKVHVDARGRILGRPVVDKSSGYAAVDRIFVDFIVDEASYEPARRKDTGEPRAVWVTEPILFENP